MDSTMLGFIIWAIVGAIKVFIGIGSLFSKKAVGFWANIDVFPVKDIKRYNRAVGVLFICYGIIFSALGIPLLGGQNTPYILLSVLGVMIETILLMTIYNLVIAKRYKG